MRDRVSAARRAGQRVGLVPTMGALHAGHERLIAQARRDCDFVVVSIFVNPLQFDREDDLRKYPRSLDDDLNACSRLGVDVVFAPSVAEMYPAPLDCFIDVGRVADRLCGRFRPGHFRGVATVVMKLLQIAQPDRAYFGEKDAQQLAVVRRLVTDLNVPVEIVGVPTVREADGLALSSRNRLLQRDDRRRAVVLYEALREMQRLISSGEAEARRVKAAGERTLQPGEGVKLEYLEIVDPDDMQPVETINRPVVAAGAIWVGGVRLIDNLLCAPPARPT